MNLVRFIAALALLALSQLAAAQSFGVFTVPSATDERNTYKSWGWTWNTNQEPETIVDPIQNYVVNDPDIHGDTEGDDLWAYLMQYQRSGNPIFLNRARAWLRYWVNDALKCQGDPYRSYCYDRDAFQADHMYGSGLLAWYVYTCSTGGCDQAALATAEVMGGDVEAYLSKRVNGTWPTPGQFPMAYYEIRGHARHLLLATRLAEVTGKARWVQLRDRYIALWLASPDWDARGMYFLGDYATDQQILTPGSYAAGARVTASMEVGILAEALAQAYRTTGNTQIRDRLVALASFVDQYALDPAYQYAASRFGFVGGKPWHSYNPSGATTVNPSAFWDPVYTTSFVNLLAYAYKYTGATRYLDRAKYFFDRGNKGIYGSPTQRQAGPTQVGHFVDTLFATSTGNFYLEYNKGELQYTYMLFENGGRPTVLAGGTQPPPPPPPPPPATPTLSFAASATTIIAGQSVTLTWSSANTTGCSASDGWSGAKPTGGTAAVSPAANVTYTLACTGPGGTVTRSVTITVRPPSDPSELTNGATVTGISVARGSGVQYRITVPAGARNLRIQTSGGTGNADLYVRFGATPTLSVYDYRSRGTGNDQSITIAAPRAGTYHLLVYGRRNASGVALTASYQ